MRIWFLAVFAATLISSATIARDAIKTASGTGFGKTEGDAADQAMERLHADATLGCIGRSWRSVGGYKIVSSGPGGINNSLWVITLEMKFECK